MLFIIMVGLVQCKLPADSSFSNIRSLWNGVLGSVGLFPEGRGNCLWHTGQPSVLRCDCEQLTVPSALGWRDNTSCGEDTVSSSPHGARVPHLRNCAPSPCVSPESAPAGADRGGGGRSQRQEEPAFWSHSPRLVLLQKRSELLQQAVEGLKDSVLPLACVHSCPWVLPSLQADSHCGEVSQRRVLASSPPSSKSWVSPWC